MERDEIAERLRLWQEGQIMKRQKQSKWSKDKREERNKIWVRFKGICQFLATSCDFIEQRGAALSEAVI